MMTIEAVRRYQGNGWINVIVDNNAQVNVGDRYVFSHPSSGDWILINGLEEAGLCARPNNKRKKVIVVL